MRGIDFLADTNALIYLLTGNPCMKPYLDVSFSISVISRMELLSFPDIRPEEENAIKEYLHICHVIAISSAIEDTAIAIRRKYRTKLPDAIIAATALVCGAKLITADKGFEKIAQLQLQLITP